MGYKFAIGREVAPLGVCVALQAFGQVRPGFFWFALGHALEGIKKPVLAVPAHADQHGTAPGE